MSKPKLRFFFREPTIDTNLPLVDGTVTVDGFDLQVADGEWDAIDHPFGPLVAARERDEPLVAIPAYPNRKFRQSYIQVRAGAGIEMPKDLEGRRVGIRQWTNTAGMWMRGALQHYYGVDLSAITWVSGGGDAVEVPPGFTVVELPGTTGRVEDEQLDRLLVEGEVDVVLSPNVLPSVCAGDPRTRRLFADYRAEEQRYYVETGIFPISHVVTLRAEFVERYPHAPVCLLEAFRRARDEALRRIEGSDPVILTISWAAVNLREQRELMGERYWPYNVQDNRRSIDAMLDYGVEQGVTTSRVEVDGVFHPAAATLGGH